MIVRMKHLDLVCVAAEKEATLERLRDLGAVHLDLSAAAGSAVPPHGARSKRPRRPSA